MKDAKGLAPLMHRSAPPLLSLFFFPFFLLMFQSLLKPGSCLVMPRNDTKIPESDTIQYIYRRFESMVYVRFDDSLPYIILPCNPQLTVKGYTNGK